MRKFQITIKARAKHGFIYNYICDHGLTLLEAAKKIGISSATLIKMIHFKWVPTDDKKNQKTAEKLCKFFGRELDELFPPEIIDVARILQNEQILNKDIELLCLDEIPRNLLSYEENFDEFELREVVNKALNTLTERQQKVIRMRFGFDGKKYTLDEVGAELGVQKERARQIEGRALKILQHPTRSKMLREFFD